MGVLLYAVFIGSVNLKCLFLKHAHFFIKQYPCLPLLLADCCFKKVSDVSSDTTLIKHLPSAEII